MTHQLTTSAGGLLDVAPCSRWELLMAAATISMVPTVILVLALQNCLVKGVALSGLGGR